MKKYIILLILILSAIVSFSQNEYELQMQSEIKVSGWILVGSAQNCQPSFYWIVTKSQRPDAYGRHLFKIYFYSNSRYCNGAWAGTYLQGVYFFVNGKVMNQNNPYWIMFKETYHNPIFSVWEYDRAGGVRLDMNIGSISIN